MYRNNDSRSVCHTIEYDENAVAYFLSQTSFDQSLYGFHVKHGAFYDYSFKDLNANRKQPLGISVGAGIPIKRSKIHSNMDFVSGLSNYSRLDVPDIEIGEATQTPVLFNEERQFVFNVGLGGKVYISENLHPILDSQQILTLLNPMCQFWMILRLTQ
ncbi:MAG: hypothetical protein ACJART_000486 [Maribacter sp.]